jgi:hypothetical protein
MIWGISQTINVRILKWIGTRIGGIGDKNFTQNKGLYYDTFYDRNLRIFCKKLHCPGKLFQPRLGAYPIGTLLKGRPLAQPAHWPYPQTLD